MNETSTEFFCPECGTPVAKTDLQCPRCGIALEWDETAHFAAIQPMQLGDIFDKTFRMFGKVFVRALPVVAIFLVPVAVILGAGSHEFYATLGRLMEQNMQNAGTEELLVMFRAMALFFLALGIAALMGMVVELSVTLLIRQEFAGSRLAWTEAFKKAIGIRFLRALGVAVLQLCAAGCVVVVPIGLLLIAGSGALMAVLVVLLFPVVFALAIYLVIRWSMAFTAVACEEESVIGAFGTSWRLVYGNWWRVFGILLLFGVIANFAVGIVTTPISMITLWDFYREYFRMLGTIGHGQPDPAMVGRMLSSMGVGVGVSAALNMMLLALVKPVYTTVLYFDLRSRTGEFLSQGT